MGGGSSTLTPVALKVCDWSARRNQLQRLRVSNKVTPGGWAHIFAPWLHDVPVEHGSCQTCSHFQSLVKPSIKLSVCYSS